MANNNYIEKDLGLVTAYGECVAGGYRGTRADFQRLIARMANGYLTYNDINDKPKINGVELVGNKTSSDLRIGGSMSLSVQSFTTIVNSSDTFDGRWDFYFNCAVQGKTSLGIVGIELTAESSGRGFFRILSFGTTGSNQYYVTCELSSRTGASSISKGTCKLSVLYYDNQ